MLANPVPQIAIDRMTLEGMAAICCARRERTRRSDVALAVAVTVSEDARGAHPDSRADSLQPGSNIDIVMSHRDRCMLLIPS